MSNEIVSEFYELIGMVKEYINYQKMCGVDYCPREGSAPVMNGDAGYIDMEDTLAKELHTLTENTKAKFIDDSPSVNKGEDISALLLDIGDCKRCKLASTRTKLVFGEGSLNAPLVFVGEAPGKDEDASGRPFVGRAGKLLTKIIEAMGLTREDVYIMNLVKCRPPENRNPQDDEIRTCEPFMLKQLSIIRPKVICTLGTFSTHTLLGTKTPISKLRGIFADYHGIKLMPTYHPAFCLRNPNMKKPVWEDMQKIMTELNLKV